MSLGRTVLVVPVVVLALAACGTDAADDSGAASPSPAAETTADTTPETTAEPDAGDTAEAASEAEVAVATSELGPILVDGSGRSLYRFDDDSPGSSSCSGDCATAWPPLTGEVTAGDGVDAALLGSIEREDGTVQATYDGWPLYYFAQDEAPGDIAGQAVNEVWWLVAPDGQRVTGEAGSASPGGDY